MKKLYLSLLILAGNYTYAQDWNFVDQITPIEAVESDYGIRSALIDDKLVVTWPQIFTNGNDADNCGELITYQKDSNGEYQEIARLTAEDLTGSCEFGDGFGEGLAYNNGRLAIALAAGQRKGWGFSGTSNDTDSRVFITHFENGNWVLDETLVADDLADGQQGMGVRVIFEDDILLVEGNTYNDIFGIKFAVSNSIYVFEDSGNGFEQTQKLTENHHLYGLSVDFEDNQIVVGSFGEQNISTAGRVFIYEKNAGSWQNTQTINDTRNINLGSDISINGNIMAIGGVHAGGIGGVAIYNKDNSGTWSETQFIEASNAHNGDQFGFEAELFGDELIVGAPKGKDDSAKQGAVYVYKLAANGQFVENQILTANVVTQEDNNFGGNVTYNATDLLVNSASGGFGGEDTTFHHYSREANPGNPTFPVGSKSSGSWKVNNAENQNVNIELLTDGRVVLFASLNESGENFWVFAIGQVNDNLIDFPHVMTTQGANFGTNFMSSDVIRSDKGEIQIALNQCDNAVLSYNLDGHDANEVIIEKDIEIPGNECHQTTKTLQSGVSGAWFDTARNGEGFTNYLYTLNGVQYAQITWYTYDLNGNQMWLRGTGRVNNQTVEIDEMTKYTGANLFDGTTNETVMGTLSMTWDGCNNAVVNYDFSASNLGSGSYNLSQLTVLENTQCTRK